MTEDLKKLSFDRLVELINYHNKKYWEEASPEISDEEYDGLMRELESRDPFHPLLSEIFPQKIKDVPTVKHAKPLLSLDKAYSHSELLKWAAKVARSEDELFIVQPKYDGISAVLEDGILATRGDGYNGEDISDKLCLVELEKKDYKGSPLGFNARGEIVIRNDDFKSIYTKIIKKDGKPYKNQRNAVAGIVGLKDISEIKMQGAKLTLIDYETYGETVSFAQLKDLSLWNKIIEKFSILPYPSDGLVIKLYDREYSESLGFTAHHPRGQIAFKFSGLRAVSLIKDIQWSFGKKCLTPLALIEPVEISGITIKKLTLHNYKFLKDNDIQIGDKIVVERAGDVIPHIVSSEPGENRKKPDIEYCPACSAKLAIEGPELICPNTECPEIEIQRLLAAVRNIGIERLGESTLRKMREKLGVRHLSDVFSLSIDDILKIDGFKEKSSTNLYSEIQSAKETTDFSLLASLNIPGIGKNIAKDILSKYSLDELRKMNESELENIFGIGPERARAIYRCLKEESDTIDELIQALKIKHTKGSSVDDQKTVCFTGKMPMPRSYYEKLAEKHSFVPVDSVTDKLSCLVAADPNENSSKLQKARKYSVKIYSLEEWLKDLNKNQIVVETTKSNDISDELPLG